MVTSIRQINLKYDSVLMRIWYIEMEYDLNGTSFFIGHGDDNPNRLVRNTATVRFISKLYLFILLNTIWVFKNHQNLFQLEVTIILYLQEINLSTSYLLDGK